MMTHTHLIENGTIQPGVLQDMLKNKLIDGIIKEPMGGAHRDHTGVFESVSKEIQKHLKRLMSMDADTRIAARIKKFENMGVVKK